MKKALLRNISIILAVLLISGVTVAAVASIDRAEPETPLKDQVTDISLTSSVSDTIQLDQKSENSNLSNQITQKQKEQREKDAADPGKKDQQQDQKNDQAADDQNKPDEPKNPDDDDGNENQGNNKPPEDYEDLPEDAYVEESIPVDDLLKELDIKDADQIIYAKSITGTGKDALLKLVNGVYSVYLSTQGTTIIQIKYKDNDGNIKTYNKKIEYKRPEGSTPVKKRPIINTSLKNEATYTNQTLNFDVWITNYRGKPLSYNNMVVTVNGREADYIGEMDRQTYSTKLKVGANTIRIKVTDSYQYTVTKVYTVYYKSGKGTITISLEAGTIGIKYMISPTKMKVESGTPLSYVVDEFLKANGFDYSCNGTLDEGFYLAQVKKKNLIKGYKIPKDLIAKIKEDKLIFDEENYEDLNTLGEHDFCQGSGWMYSINGVYSSYGFSKAFVQSGDVVRIRYTLAYGKDIGGYAVAGGQYGELQDYGKEW